MIDVERLREAIEGTNKYLIQVLDSDGKWWDALAYLKEAAQAYLVQYENMLVELPEGWVYISIRHGYGDWNATIWHDNYGPLEENGPTPRAASQAAKDKIGEQG